MACAARFGGKQGSLAFRTCLIYSDLLRSARLQCVPGWSVFDRPLSCCGTRHLPSASKRLGICRPLPLAQVASPATGGAPIAPRSVSLLRQSNSNLSGRIRRGRVPRPAGGEHPRVASLAALRQFTFTPPLHILVGKLFAKSEIEREKGKSMEQRGVWGR